VPEDAQKSTKRKKSFAGLYSLLNLIINGGNVEFGLRDADLVYHCEINTV
jgi:hypothetical protein